MVVIQSVPKEMALVLANVYQIILVVRDFVTHQSHIAYYFIIRFFLDPYAGCRPECVVNDDCPYNKACQQNRCYVSIIGIIYIHRVQ